MGSNTPNDDLEKEKAHLRKAAKRIMTETTAVVMFPEHHDDAHRLDDWRLFGQAASSPRFDRKR